MRMSKMLHLVFAAGLLLGLLPLAAAARPPAQGATIEQELLDKLSVEGTADFFVKMAVEADLSAAYDIADWDARGEYVYATLVEVARISQAAVIESAERQGLEYASFLTTNAVFVRGGDLQAAQNLAALPGVAYLRLERVLRLPEPLPSLDEDGGGARPEATLAWGIQDVHANQAWSLGARGAGIKVANIDSGVDWDHPALVDQFACPGNPGNPACWRDPSNICGGSACDNNGHGTHTMGTMVAADDSSLTWIAGMAPDATWIACKGCESNQCSDFALNACADWILAPGGNTANRPHVVNNSWGGDGGDTWYLAKVNAWRAAGIYPAFSAGNEGPSCGSTGSPGDYQASFASAAHNSSRTVASFSGRGPSSFGHDPYTKPNISAPGVSVCSTMPGGGWSCGYSGTSMASPHSAGAVALIWSACPSYRGQIDMTFELLQDTADTAPTGTCGAPSDGEGNYTYGYGYLNVLAAVQQCALPAAPVLAPISNPDYDGTYLVDWSDVTSATSYTLQEDDNASFSSPTTRSTSNSQFQVTGQSAGTWYYRVRASSSAGNSPWSNTRSVRVVAVPSAPQLQTISNPGNDDEYQVTWSSVSGASSYTLQEASNSAFTGATTRYAGAAVQYNVTGQDGGTWYYRVRASNVAGSGPWSNVQSVTVTAAPLSKPTLAPISNPGGDGDYLVDWSDVTGATSYILEESSSPYFESPSQVYSGSASQFAVSGQRGGTWHYRVRASGLAGKSPWSGSQSVMVTSYVYMPLVLRNYTAPGQPPASPTLSSISNSDGDGNYIVGWSAAGGATTYTLQEANNSSFTGATTAYAGAGTSVSISGKTAGTYYYRVNASNAYGTSAWSHAESVVVAGSSGPTPGYWADADGVEFYVTTNQAYVDDFAIYVNVDGCGNYKITHSSQVPITGGAFAFTGSFYGSGVFGSATSCSGITGLWDHYLPGCGLVSGGPWSYAAIWQYAALGTGTSGSATVVAERVGPDAAPGFLMAVRSPD